MATIDPQASMKLQSELMPGERIFWAGMPNPSVIFHTQDWIMVPFSLLWGGFTLFMGADSFGWWHGKPGTTRTWDFGAIIVAAFIVIGQHFIWGRFVMDAWLKRHTYYAVTDRRILLLQEGFKRKTRAVFLDAVGEIQRDGSSTGSIWLGSTIAIFGGRYRQNRGMSFVNIYGEGPSLSTSMTSIPSTASFWTFARSAPRLGLVPSSQIREPRRDASFLARPIRIDHRLSRCRQSSYN
jgi:hypothetical protein